MFNWKYLSQIKNDSRLFVFKLHGNENEWNSMITSLESSHFQNGIFWKFFDQNTAIWLVIDLIFCPILYKLWNYFRCRKSDCMSHVFRVWLVQYYGVWCVSVVVVLRSHPCSSFGLLVVLLSPNWCWSPLDGQAPNHRFTRRRLV